MMEENNVEVGVVVFAFCCLLLFTGYLLYSFSDKDNYWSYTIAVYLSWVLGFSGVILLPLDLAYAKKVTVENNPLLGSWIFVFWSTFFLAWIIDPIMQSFHDNGSYEPKTRLCGALKENIKFYVIIVVIVVGVFILLFFLNEQETDIDTFVEVLIDLGTVYGMLFIIVLLGLGLVEVPRSLWQRSDPIKSLKRLHFESQEIENEYQDARFELEAIIRAVKSAEQQESRNGEVSELGMFISHVVAKCPLHVIEEMSSSNNRTNEHNLDIVDIDTFSKLHAKLLKALRLYKSTSDKWQQTLNYADELEALVAGRPPAYAMASNFGKFYWRWRVTLGKPFLMICAVVCGIFSLAIIWGEVTIMLVDAGSPVLSIYGWVVQVTSGGVDTMIATFLPLFYMAYCMFFTMFDIKFLKHYKLTKRSTDASGLLFNAYYLCRLQFSLGYNFLLVLDYATVQSNNAEKPNPNGRMLHKAFQSVIGNMSSITWFNRYSPVVLISLSLATAFNWHAKVLSWIGVDVFVEPQEGNAEHTDRIEEGKRLLRRERDKRERDGICSPGRVNNGISLSSMKSRTPKKLGGDVYKSFV